MAKKKITVSISEELYEWCSKQSDSYGMSVPSLFVVAMAQYKEQLISMNNFPELLDRLKALELKDNLK